MHDETSSNAEPSSKQPPSSRLPSLHCLGLYVFVSVFVGFSVQLSGQAPGDWTQFHRTNMERWNPYENVLNVNNVGSLDLKWSYVTAFDDASSPAVANGVVYVCSFDNNVYALSANTGAKLWSYATGAAVSTSAAVADGVVYVGSSDNSVYALNASTGDKLWSYATGSAVTSPAVADGVVYVGSFDNNVYALNASTGAKLWSYATRSAVATSPAVANGVVYVGSWDNNVYALSASTGAKLWSYTTGNFVSSSPAVANGVVYIGSLDGNVYALSASTGAKLWSYATGDQVSSSPAVANGVVYVGSFDNNVYALSASTGTKLWSYATGSHVASSPTVTNGVVYITSDQVYSFSNTPSAGFFSFPLQHRNAFDAKIVTVFDHSSDYQYCPDNVVEAYDGEKGTLQYGKDKSPASGYCNYLLKPLYGFAQSGYERFFVNGQYIGADGDSKGHSGIDFLEYDGHPGYDFETTDQSIDGKIPVLAAADGTVVCTHVPSDCTDGTRTDFCVEGPGEIKIKHPNGYFSVYLHLSHSSVTQGEQVSPGQQIGIAGATGTPHCASPHLHFEIRKGKPGCDIDAHCSCNRAQTQQVNNCVPVDPYGWLGDPAKDPYTHKGTKVPNVNLWK